MNLCKNCKYWEKHSKDHLGDCSKWLKGYSIEASNIPYDQVRVENDEGWGAEMGPNFGCVLWESK